MMDNVDHNAKDVLSHLLSNMYLPGARSTCKTERRRNCGSVTTRDSVWERND